VRVHNEVPGIVVPDRVQKAFEDAGPDAPKLGRELVQQMLEDSRSLAAGAYVVAPFRQPLGVLDVLPAV
jgi:hypothetical protein